MQKIEKIVERYFRGKVISGNLRDEISYGYHELEAYGYHELEAIPDWVSKFKYEFRILDIDVKLKWDKFNIKIWTSTDKLKWDKFNIKIWTSTDCSLSGHKILRRYILVFFDKYLATIPQVNVEVYYCKPKKFLWFKW